MKIRFIKDTGHCWYDFKIPSKYGWHLGMSCLQEKAIFIVEFARGIIRDWNLINFFYDLVDPISLLFDEIRLTKVSKIKRINIQKERSGHLIKIKKKNIKNEIKNVERLIDSIKILENQLPKTFKYKMEDLNQLKERFASNYDDWNSKRAGEQIPIRNILMFLWDRLDKTHLSNLEKRKFILSIFKQLKYKDYDSIPEKTALKRIYQLLYRAGR